MNNNEFNQIELQRLYILFYRSGYVVLEIFDVVTGVYNVIPSTFYPKTEAPYFLSFFTSAPIKISRLK